MGKIFYDEDDENDENGIEGWGGGNFGDFSHVENLTDSSSRYARTMGLDAPKYEPKRAYEDSRMWKKFSAKTGLLGWVVGKPKLAAKIPEDPLSPKVQKINGVSVVTRLFVLTIGMIAVTVFAMWLIFALTFMPTVNVSGSLYLVDRTAWVTGEAPVGSLVYTNGEPVERSLLSRVEGLLPIDEGGSIVEIVGENEFGDYLTSCVSGGCENSASEEVSVVAADEVLGEVSLKFGFLYLTRMSDAVE